MIVEIPHFGSMRGKERELIVLRSDNGDTWKEHQTDARPEDLTDLLAGMDEGKRKLITSQNEPTYCKHRLLGVRCSAISAVNS